MFINVIPQQACAGMDTTRQPITSGICEASLASGQLTPQCTGELELCITHQSAIENNVTMSGHKGMHRNGVE